MHDTLRPTERVQEPRAESARRHSERLQGALLVLLLAIGAWQGVAALATPSAQRRLAPVLNSSAFFNGRMAATVNFVEAHYLPADHLLRAAGGIFRWKAFGSGGPLVSVGCGDWLFLTEEAQTYNGARSNLKARANIAIKVASALRKRGIELVVAVVPDKARIESAALCGAPRSAQLAGRYQDFSSLLHAGGVTLVDLADPFHKANADSAVYYRTDTHWNQTGAALAARTIAAAVHAPLEKGFAYRTDKATTPSDGPGDLLRLMSLDLVPDKMPLVGSKLRPSPDRQFLEHTLQTEHPPESNDLLATGPGDQVVLLGSSYSKNANFQGRLEEALHAPVNNVAEAGGGFAGAASTYLRSNTFAETPPRVIVWEMPERALSKTLTETDEQLAAFN